MLVGMRAQPRGLKLQAALHSCLLHSDTQPVSRRRTTGLPQASRACMQRHLLHNICQQKG